MWAEDERDDGRESAVRKEEIVLEIVYTFFHLLILHILLSVDFPNHHCHHRRRRWRMAQDRYLEATVCLVGGCVWEMYARVRKATSIPQEHLPPSTRNPELVLPAFTAGSL